MFTIELEDGDRVFEFTYNSYYGILKQLLIMELKNSKRLKVIWLEEKEILNEYCYKKAHLFDFNF